MGGDSGVSLGLGLIGIGRQWGVRPVPLPSQADIDELLDRAVAGGIRFFDTAPSYGASESRFGAWLARLTSGQRAELTVATKCGDHWDETAGAPFMDHSYDALRRSIDRSFDLLGCPDLLQIHRATPAVVRDAGVRRAFDYARERGVRQLGVSASDLETALLAVGDPFFSTVQIYFNVEKTALEPVFTAATRAGRQVLVNRPFAMGGLLYDAGGAFRGEAVMVDAFRFILSRPFRGVVLTGTRSAAHLEANIAAFNCARMAV